MRDKAAALTSLFIMLIGFCPGVLWADLVPDITRFQLVAADSSPVRCIAPEVPDASDEETVPRYPVVPVSNCDNGARYLWELSTNNKLINTAYRGGEESGQTLCLTRHYSEAGIVSVSLEPCLAEGADSQSWHFDSRWQAV